MEFKTVILRFRDLVTENDATIARHKETIEKRDTAGGDDGIKEMRKSHLRNFVY